MSTQKITITLMLGLGFLLIILLLISRQSNSKSTTIIRIPTITISPNPSVTIPQIDPTIAAIPSQETGGNMDVTLTTTEQAHNDLFFKVPLDMQNFIVDFDYADNKFSVLILNDAGEDAYNKWRKDSYPALSDDQFVINDKRI